MKRILLAITMAVAVAILLPEAAFANPVSLSKAQSYAARFLKKHTNATAIAPGNSGALKARSINGSAGSTQPAFYIFNAVDNTGSPSKGYVIVSAEDGLPELIGYSLNKSWPTDENRIPPALREIMQGYQAYVEDLRAGKAKLLPTTQSSSSADSHIVVDTMLTTKWDQTYPYNMYAPDDTTDTSQRQYCYNYHYKVGCGAVALGQIIKYWGIEHPLRHTTYFDYVDIHDNFNVRRDTVTLDPATFYDSANLPDSIGLNAEQSGMTEEEWNYKADKTGRFLIDVAHTMNTYFDYVGGETSASVGALSAIMGFGFSFDARTFETKGIGMLGQEPYLSYIKQDLMNGRPVYCGGQTDPPGDGHAFVLDGLDSDNLVHVNWGFGGECNDWFRPDYLNALGYSLTRDNMIIFNLHPRTNEETIPFNDELLVNQGTLYTAMQNGSDATIYNEQDEHLTPVCYVDRNHNYIYQTAQARHYLRPYGFDLEWQTTNTFTPDGQPAETVDSTFTDAESKLDTMSSSADISLEDYLDMSMYPEGLYTYKAQVRQILGSQTGEWQTTPADSMMIKGADAILNPSDYNKYFHAPCNPDKNHCYIDEYNQFLLHADYVQNPTELAAGNSLDILNDIRIFFLPTVEPLYPEKSSDLTITMTHKGVTETLETVLSFEDLPDLYEMIGPRYVGSIAESYTFPEEGEYEYTVSWPCMGLELRDTFNVASSSGIDEIPGSMGENPGDAAVYDLNGRRLKGLQPGVSIVKSTNGTVKKIAR